MKKFYLLIFGLILSMGSKAQISQCNEALMYGGSIKSYDKNTSCVLVATGGGIFSTTNKGLSWTNVTKNFDPYSVKCRNLVCVSNDFYALSDNSAHQNIFKSTNNGVNWNPILNTFSGWWPQSLGKIGNTLYAVGGDNMGGHIYTSNDGVNWTPKAQVWNNMWNGGNCDLLSFNQSKIYLNFKDSLFFTSDGIVLDTVSFNGLGISSFKDGSDNFDGDAFGNLYYRGNALFKYNFTSKSWSDISTGKIATGYQMMDFSATDNFLFLTVMNNMVGIKFYKSADKGIGFTEVNTGLSVPIIENIIEVATNSFIGNDINEGVIISSNAGLNWSSNSTGQYTATYAGNLIRSGAKLLYSKDVRGVVLSSNQAANWNVSNTGIPGFGGIAYFVNDIFQVKDTLFGFVQTDPFTQQIEMYKSTNNGTSWAARPITSFLGEDFRFAGKCDSALFLSYFDVNANNYALIASFDFGKTWSKPSGNNSNRLYLKGPKSCLFACFEPGNNSWGDFSNVYKTTNLGGAYTDINQGGLFNNNFMIKRELNGKDNKGQMMMDYNLSNNKAVFVVVDRMFNSGTDKLYQYTFNTNTWSEISASGLPTDYYASSIKFIGGNSWLLATNTGVYRSSNGCLSWTLAHNANDWQNGMIVNSIQNISNNVFLGTIANGVWVLTLSVGILEPFDNGLLQLYPNPSINLVNIVLPEFKENKEVDASLYGIDGKLILNKNFNAREFQLDINSVASGTYLLVIHAGDAIYQRRIVRE